MEEIRKFVEADSLGYLSLEALRRRRRRRPKHEYCYACYTGDYPTELVHIEDLLASKPQTLLTDEPASSPLRPASAAFAHP